MDSLAYCELYLAVSALAIHVIPHVELFETNVTDVQYDHDTFVPQPAITSKGVRVLVK
jgi:hypothetical protein